MSSTPRDSADPTAFDEIGYDRSELSGPPDTEMMTEDAKFALGF